MKAGPFAFVSMEQASEHPSFMGLSYDVPDVTGFLSHVATRLAELEAENISLKRSISRVEASLARKADVNDLEELASRLPEIQLALGLKASIDDVPSNEDFQALAARVPLDPCAEITELRASLAQKADICTAANLQQLIELQNLVNVKASVGSVPSLEQYEDLLRSLDRKADTRTVPTKKQFEDLVAKVQAKADLETVPSKEEVKALLAEKANTKEVPTIEDFEELRAPKRSRLSWGWFASSSSTPSKLQQSGSNTCPEEEFNNNPGGTAE